MEINPDNDKTITFELNLRNPTTGVKEPVTSGTVTAIIATTDASTATEAHASFVFTCSYIAGQLDDNGQVRPAGTWMAFINGAVLTSAILSALPAKLWLIARKTGDIRAVVPLDNVDARYATVVS